MTILIIIVVVAFLLFMWGRRTRFGGYRPNGYQNPDPFYPPSAGPGMGSFMGGMAAGALLSFLFEQGRIDMGQYNDFNGMEQNQMMQALMDQNIIQQDEIDQLQRQMDMYDGNAYVDGSNGTLPDPVNMDGNVYQNDYNQVDYSDNNYADNSDFNDNGNGDNWV